MTTLGQGGEYCRRFTGIQHSHPAENPGQRDIMKAERKIVYVEKQSRAT